MPEAPGRISTVDFHRDRALPVVLGVLLAVAGAVALLGAIAAAASVVQWLPWAPLVAAPLLLAAAFLVLSRPVTRSRGVAATVLVLLVVAIPVVGHLRHETGGRMISVDDTGLPSRPIEEGWIVVLPSADATWDLLGARPGATDFEHLGASLDEDDVAAAGGRVQPIGLWGRFDLPVEPGDWVLCYAWSNTEFGFVAGCSAVQLSAGDLVEASWGEGGFGAS